VADLPSDSATDALSAAGSAHHEYEQTALKGVRDEQWASWPSWIEAARDHLDASFFHHIDSRATQLITYAGNLVLKAAWMSHGDGSG
jgi:hypothetical protein